MLVLSRAIGEAVIVGNLQFAQAMYVFMVTNISSETDSAAVFVVSAGESLKPRTVKLACDENFKIGETIEVTLVGIKDDRARIGITSPRAMAVHRLEVWEAICRENRDRGDDAGESKGSPVPLTPKPGSPSTDVRLDEPKGEDEN